MAALGKLVVSTAYHLKLEGLVERGQEFARSGNLHLISQAYDFCSRAENSGVGEMRLGMGGVGRASNATLKKKKSLTHTWHHTRSFPSSSHNTPRGRNCYYSHFMRKLRPKVT